METERKGLTERKTDYLTRDKQGRDIYQIRINGKIVTGTFKELKSKLDEEYKSRLN